MSVDAHIESKTPIGVNAFTSSNTPVAVPGKAAWATLSIQNPDMTLYFRDRATALRFHAMATLLLYAFPEPEPEPEIETGDSIDAL